MKNILYLLTLLLTFEAFAQKEEEIEYYTDSYVKHSKVYFDAVYSPYFVNRRVLSNSFSQNQLTNFLNQSSKGSYGQSYGIDMFLKFNSNFHLGVGVNRSNGAYSLDFNRFFQDIGAPDSLQGGSMVGRTEFSYLNVPIQIVFATPLTDEFELEILPSIELNFIQSMVRSLDTVNVPFDPNFDLGDDYWSDRTDAANQFNWSVGLGVGGNYYLSEHVSVFLRGHVRYMIQPMITDGGPNEVLLWLGGQAGLKFYL